MIEKKRIHNLVRETSRIAGDLGMVDRARNGKKVSDNTRADYQRVGKRLLDLEREDYGGLMTDVSAASYHKIRAALMHVSAARYLEHRKACDDAQRIGDLGAAQKHATFASRAVNAYIQIAHSERPAPTKARASKRGSLPRADDWQARIYDAATPSQRASVALMWATGCRPAEIEMGVLIDRVKYKGDKIGLRVTIRGAKVSEHSGQPTRFILIDAEAPSGRALIQQMDGKVRLEVQRKATRINKDFEKIRLKTGLKVAPYSLRHQFSANLKAEWGPDAADRIALAMGHAVTRSQSRYGSVRQAQSGGTGVLGVKATRPVKETRSAPKDPGPKSAAPSPI